MAFNGKYIKASEKYKHIYLYRGSDGKTIYYNIKIELKGIPPEYASYKNERDAALHVDKYLIRNGKPPVNILKPKKQTS